MNKKFMKISATSLAVLMATSNIAMAAPGDVHYKTGGKILIVNSYTLSVRTIPYFIVSLDQVRSSHIIA